MTLKNLGLVALVAVVSMGVMSAAEAKDRWGFSVSPYGSSFHYRTGGSSFGFSSYPSYGYGYGYGSYPSYYHHPATVPSYSTYGYNPHAAHHGAHEPGYGSHAYGYSSPYRHGTHHGYHYSPEWGWHGGTHYGHR